MGRKKKPKPEDPERSAAFVEMAEQIQAEDADERFEEAMKRILKAKRKDSNDRDVPRALGKR